MSTLDIANLKKGQAKMTRMMYEFDRICRKYELSYWCMGGTLVGTLRHAGWVPWDGDLDVGMLDSDYDVFYKVAEKELPKDLWLQDARHDKNHHKVHNKIRDLNSCYDKWIKGPKKYLNGLCLDIFLYKKEYNKLVAYKNENISKHDEVYDINFIFPPKEMEFEGISVYVPNNYQQYSINSWGTYPPQTPSLEHRFPHEGRIIPDKPCSWHKKEYPQLYPRH
tara:strand:- start:908 stop:1573 length:666 start_codon:yes stop_codon:yes gene_type:complete